MYAGYSGMEYFDSEKTMENLLKAETAARRYEESQRGEVRFYNSIFLNKCEHTPGAVTRNYEHDWVTDLYIKITSNNCFESMKDLPEFKELLERLQAES